MIRTRINIIIMTLVGMLCIPPGMNNLYAQVSISPGEYITVKSGGSLMIGTDLHIKSIAGSSGALADQNVAGDITVTGNVTVDRYMTADLWHNVATPLNNQTSAIFTGTDLVFWYDETQIWNDWNFGWIWYTGATGGPLMVFRGYDVYFDAGPVTVSYQGAGSTLNTGSYTYNVTITNPAPNPTEIPSHLGWNLAGNPYPSPVDWLAASGWDKSDINDAKYIWDGGNDIYTIFIGGGSPYGLNGGTRFIPSNQGFWVQATQTGTIGINNAVRIGSMTATPDYYKVEIPDYPVVDLTTSGNGKSDEIAVRFIEGTKSGWDRNYDASKLFSYIEDVPQLSIQSGKQVLAISTLPAITDGLAVQLNFQCGKDGLYNIRLSPRTILESSTRVFLEDKLADVFVNLRKDSVFNFFYDTQEQKDRFTLWFNPSEDILNHITASSYFSVFSVGNEITILKNTEEEVTGNVIIYNLLGQPLVARELGNASKTIISIDLPAGCYVVAILANQHISNFKVLINN